MTKRKDLAGGRLGVVEQPEIRIPGDEPLRIMAWKMPTGLLAEIKAYAVTVGQTQQTVVAAILQPGLVGLVARLPKADQVVYKRLVKQYAGNVESRQAD